MNKALMVLDVQSDFLGNTQDYMTGLCQTYLDECGDTYQAVILSQWTYDDLQGVCTLTVHHPNAHIVSKQTYSGLTEEVQDIFRHLNIEEVHLAGVDTELTILATMFALVDAGYHVKVLERLVSSYHGRNWEAMMIVRHAIGPENVLNAGGGRVWL